VHVSTYFEVDTMLSTIANTNKMGSPDAYEELTRQAGASVAAIALEHGLNANLLFKWRREYLGSPALVKPTAQAIRKRPTNTVFDGVRSLRQMSMT
jgi:hypothetical protein